MRCPRCHGSRMINGQPCPECLSGQVSCCEGASCGDPYDDPSYPERECDYCRKLYRGPAVYCSLECATDDL